MPSAKTLWYRLIEVETNPLNGLVTNISSTNHMIYDRDLDAVKTDMLRHTVLTAAERFPEFLKDAYPYDPIFSKLVINPSTNVRFLQTRIYLRYDACKYICFASEVTFYDPNLIEAYNYHRIRVVEDWKKIALIDYRTEKLKCVMEYDGTEEGKIETIKQLLDLADKYFIEDFMNTEFGYTLDISIK